MDKNFISEELKRKFDKYSLFIDGRDAIPVSYLASATGVSTKVAFAELQALLALGYFGNSAYMNYMTGELVLRAPASSYQKPGYSAGSGNYQRTDAGNIVQKDRKNSASEYSYSYGGTGKPINDQRRSNPQKSKNPVPQGNVKPKSYIGKGKLFFLSSFGTIMMLGAIGFLTDIFDYISSASMGISGSSIFEALIPFIMSLGIGGYCFYKRSNLGKLNHRFTTYRSVLGNEAYIDINVLASAAGVSMQKARNDLEKIIDKGLLGDGAYMDYRTDMLVIRRKDYEQAAIFKNTVKADVSNETDGDQNVAKQAQSQYYAIIKEIRELNDAIPDPDVSARIYKIEETTAKIFKTVEEKPEKLPQIKSFMSYYLPTTLKLLRSYVVFDKQGAGGGNINAAKENIEKVLDTLVKGFNQQLDQLYEADYMDISSDIEVLETMLRKDGLSDDGAFQFKHE